MLGLDDELLHVAQQWVLKAESDLVTATLAVRARINCPTDAVCFHAQQCVEKYLKAMLVLNGIEVPRTHQLNIILALLPPETRPELSPAERSQLTEYAVSTRYPGDYDPISLEEAREAVRIARRVRNAIRRQLPPDVLEGD